MALEAKVLTFTANTSTGDQDLTGTSFTPKAAILWWSYATNADSTFAENANLGMGFTDGTNSISGNVGSEDNQGTGDTATVTSVTALINVLNLTGTMTAIDGSASFVSWLSNGMRINWSNAPTSAFKIHVLFLGGTDITNVAVGAFTHPGSTTGNQDITTGFVPDLVFFMTNERVATVFNNTPRVDAGLSIGAATDSSNMWSQYTNWEEGNSISDTWQYYSHSNIFTPLNTGSGTFYYTPTYVGANGTNDGFRINWSTSGSLNTAKTGYFAIKGGSYAVGNATEPAGTGNQTITTNKDTKAVMVFGVDTGTADAVQADSMLTIGGGTSSSEMVSIAVHDTDGVGDEVNVSVYDSGAIYQNITANATASSSTVDDEASLSSVSSTGFVLNWSNIGQARPFRYVTFGSAEAQGELKYGTITESPSISVSESLARLQTRRFTIVDSPSVSVSETLERIQTIGKTISESSVTVDAGSVTALRSFAKTISESAVNVSVGAVERLRTAIKSISDDSISIGAEAITRLRTSITNIAEAPSISVSETLARIATFVKSITTQEESAINVSEQITKLIQATRSITNETPISISELLTGSIGVTVRDISESLVSISEQLAKILTLPITITDAPTVSTSEQLTRVQTLVKTITDTPTISTSEQLARTALYLKPISETPIQAPTDSIARWISISYTLAEPSIFVSEALASVFFFPRSIAEPTINNVNDAIARVQYLTRTISETPPLTIDDTIARVQTLIKEISETPPLNVNDSVQAGILFLVSLIESRIKWYYSTVTRKIPEGEV